MAHTRLPSRHLCLVILLAAAPWIGACSINPATGKKQFNMISEGRELSLGSQAAPQFLQEYGGPIPSDHVREYVRSIGHRLAEVSERPNLPWEFHAVDSSVINAFALPGGKVFITRGLLSKLENEAQLAGVLGHEIGHVTAQHIGQQMTQALIIQGVAVGLGVAGDATDKDYLRALGLGAQVGGTVYMLKFSRDDETQADELGVRYMSKLGYNPVAQIQVMEVLQREAGAGSQLEFLSTHPYPETRIDNLNKLIRKRYPQYNANPPVYAMRQDLYKQNMLDQLARLPPPKHNANAAAGGKALRGTR
jgi:predicted Zn-dependent protease